MEVHHHSHPSTGSGTRKKWAHYFWEFLMLFLAVFCGFLAEYQLEHKIENDREKQFIASLISDLKDDTARITAQLQYYEKGNLYFDSLSKLLESPQSARQHTEAIYYTARLGVRLSPFANNSRTIDQLKNSGGFRLIRSQETSGRIMSYYSRFPELRMIEDIFNGENIAFKEAASKIMDQAVYRKQILPDNSVARINGDLSLLTYDPVQLNQLGFYAVQMNGSRRGLAGLLNQLKQSAEELLIYLQKKYHLN
jgi:hypothetical protein